MNLKELPNLISKAITNAYEETEKEIRASYKHVDDKIDAIQMYSINIVKEIDKLTMLKIKESNKLKEEENICNDKQELPQYIILKDNTKKDCPIVLESKYVEEVLDFILPLIETDIDYDPNCSYPPVFKQKEWFEKDLRKSGYFGVDDGFSSKKYILSYKENKDYENK